MATYTSTLNAVLRRMRETEVAGPTSTTYAALIGDFINESKREVEDAWKWNALRTTTALTTADGVATQAITGAGKRFKLQDPINSVYNVTSLGAMTKQNSQWMKRAALTNTATGTPSSYFIEGFDSSEDPYITWYNSPDGVYTINLELIVPQADFSVGTEVFDVPSQVVKLGAIAKALAERGEDQGNTSGEANAAYNLALGDAIAMDIALTTGETTWYA